MTSERSAKRSEGNLEEKASGRGMREQAVGLAVAAGIVVSSLLFALTAFNATDWIGATFPGFFLLENRVVPSVSLPAWDAAAGQLFQHQVVSVDNAEVASSRDVYEYVASFPSGTTVLYGLRAPDGTARSIAVRSRVFSLLDFVLLFGAYLFCALVFIATGLLVFWRRPESAASVGLLSACLGLGYYALTGADLYGPHWWFRLHVLAECLFPAGIVHLALVFPCDRLRVHRAPALLVVYLPCLLLGLVYECVLDWPSAYTALHLVASALQGVGGFALLAGLAYDRFTSDSALVRWRTGVVGAGAVTAFVGPTILTGASGLLGGSVPVNGAAFTAFIFPVSLGYAVLRRDLLHAGFGAWSASAASAVPWIVRLSGALEAIAARMRGRFVYAALAVGGILATGLVGATASNSSAWIGRAFPGFLVMENRVVPSVSLAHWDGRAVEFFQHQVVAVDGEPVNTSAEVLAAAAGQPIGSELQYTLRSPSGEIRTESTPSRRFSRRDYFSLFGPFLVTGASFLLAGLLVFAVQRGSAMAPAMLSLGLIGGTFVVTAVDLYGPHWFFRLHVFAEAMVPAALIHFALVFPTNRLDNGFRPFLVATYLLFAATAGLYEVTLAWPTAYSAMHLGSVAAHGCGGLAILWVVTYDLLTTSSEPVRRRIVVVGAGTFGALLLPTVLSGASGLSGGDIAVNGAALTGFLMPWALAYGILRRA